MASPTPSPLTPAERRKRRNRVSRIARRLGFVGRIEYRHVYSQSGGAQFGLGSTPDEDLLIVYAEAFKRDANPEDFSLEAILAHECGHQLLARHPRISARVRGRISAASEEILASILGALITRRPIDKNNLAAKAIFELLRHGETAEVAELRVQELSDLLGRLL